jgi:hypothetical protein
LNQNIFYFNRLIPTDFQPFLPILTNNFHPISAPISPILHASFDQTQVMRVHQLPTVFADFSHLILTDFQPFRRFYTLH